MYQNQWFHGRDSVRQLPPECVADCSASGSVDAQVARWVDRLDFDGPAWLFREYLKGFGAWDAAATVSFPPPFAPVPPTPEMVVPNLARVYAWSVFVPSQSAWVHFRRNEMHGPGWWHSEARSQSGRVLGVRTISAEYAADLYARYGKDAEVQYYSPLEP